MSRWANKYVIGLTGNIATGKSVVRKMLQHAGAYTIDADQLAHQAMMPGAPAYKPIIDTFGQFIIGPDKQINRQLLGKMVFGNPEALKKLEAITHPIVRQGVDVLVKRAKQRVVVVTTNCWILSSSPFVVCYVEQIVGWELKRLVRRKQAGFVNFWT